MSYFKQLSVKLVTLVDSNSTDSWKLVLQDRNRRTNQPTNLLRLKCTKSDFAEAPDPTGEAHSAPLDFLVAFKVAYF